MSTPLVSILTANYNREHYLQSTIDSVLAQSYTNWEMIIIDDGSTDRSWEIISGYTTLDARIRAFRQENKGMWKIGETTNAALAHASGDLVAILDSDDVWPTDKLERQVPAHAAGGVGLSFGSVQYIDAAGAVMDVPGNPDAQRLRFLDDPDPWDLVVRNLRGEFFISPVGVLLSHDVLRDIGGLIQPSYLPVYDYSTFLLVGAASGGYTYVPGVLGLYRQHASQSTWYLARDMARGAHRFAAECVSNGTIALDAHDRRNTRRALMSGTRREYLAGSCYRSAAVAFEAGSYRQAITYWGETARLGRLDWSARCFAMLGWKSLRLLTAPLKRGIAASMGHATGRGQGR